MFRRLHEIDAPITFYLDGEALKAQAGDSVAAAILAQSSQAFRTSPVDGAPRSPYCMIGVCFECLVEIDGVHNRQACLVAVREGMNVFRQSKQALQFDEQDRDT